MQPLDRAPLRIDAASSVGGGPIRLDWRGVSNDPDPEQFLGPYLQAALAEAQAAGVAIEMSFAAMEYASSSTLAALIAFTQDAQAAGIKLVYVFDPARRWQKLSLNALQVFDAGDGLLELRPS